MAFRRRRRVPLLLALLLVFAGSSLRALDPPGAGPRAPTLGAEAPAALPAREPLAHGLEPPVLKAEAPPSMVSLAARVEGYDRGRLLETMRMVGLDDPGPPIRVVLAPEGSAAARAAPDWATGYAAGSAGVVVLIPSRSSTYPYGSFEALLQHEITHVLIARAARGRAVPRWFNEGVAMASARAWSAEDRTRLVIELLPGGRLGFDQVDALFEQGENRARRAYALSGAFVRDLLGRYGEDLPARILPVLAGGTSFEEAFRGATGTSLRLAEAAFYRRQNLWSRWIPILAGSFSLWSGISLLALYAIKKRRARDARVAAAWEIQEREMERVGPSPAGHGPGGGPGNGDEGWPDTRDAHAGNGERDLAGNGDEGSSHEA